MERKNTFFYGWVIVVVCLLIQAIPFGIASNLQPAFINFVVKGEGFSFTSFSLIFTVGTVVSAICSPFIGKLFTKVNIKILYAIGSILAGVGFMMYSFAGGHLILYYIIAGIVQIGLATISAIGVPTLINAWFKVNKGVAMGIAFAGGGVGNIFLQGIAGKWLTNPAIGYKGAYIRFGLIALVVALFLTIFFVRLPKSESELKANVPKKETQKNTIKWGYTVSEVTKMPEFWMIGISFIFVGFYVAGMALQFIAYLQGLEASGFLLIPSAKIASMYGLFSIVGSVLGGFLLDKLGLAKSYTFACVMVVLAGLSLIFLKSFNFLAYLFPIFFGISIFAYSMSPSFITSALFGDREYSTILGLIQIFFAGGFALGSPLFGMMVDNFGWSVAWSSTIIYSIIAYIGLIISCSKILNINKKLDVTVTKRVS